MPYQGAQVAMPSGGGTPKLIDLAAINIGAEATIWTPAAGKKFRLVGGLIAVSVAGTVILRDNTAGAIFCRIPLVPANTPVPFDISGAMHGQAGGGFLSAAANNVLTAIGGAAALLSGYLIGWEE